jgi:5-methylthioadenosine/S-adenosylhomocysteine deaminase
METVLLKNCRMILTKNHDLIHDYDILIENGSIARIAKTIEEKCQKLDCSRKLVMPALFNSHTHSSMALLRGYNDDKELQEWLNDIWKVEAMLTPMDMRIGALFAFMEMAKTGTYGFIDMYFEMEEVAKACNEIGLRGLLGYGMIDLSNDEKRGEEISRTKKFIEGISGKYENITPVLAPHSIYTCSPELLQWVTDYSHEKNVLKTIHLSETRKEVEDCIAMNKITPVHYLESLGFLDEKTVLFHASFIDQTEIGILEKRNSKVVHCPASNMKLATGGVFPLNACENSGIITLLGTDGACSNNSLDMFNEMKFAALLQKFTNHKASAASASQIMDMATSNPGNAFGFNNGSVEVGKRADLSILDLDNFSLSPTRNIISNLVYSNPGNSVTDLIVSGKFVVKDRKLVNMDENKIRDDFEEAVKRLY